MQAVMTPEQKVRMAPFHINQKDGNITEADGTANTWSDIWKYQVPQGSGIILQTGDQISMYLEDATAQVGDDTCYVKIEVRDAAEEEKDRLYGAALYQSVKEFQDRDTIAKLEVPKPMRVYPRQWIVISVKDDGAIDASDSYFDLFTSKVAVPLA